MSQVKRMKYGMGERIMIFNSNQTVGAIIYVDRNGYVHEDSWVNSKHRPYKKPKLVESIKYNPSHRKSF